jgi:hypothetical protein
VRVVLKYYSESKTGVSNCVLSIGANSLGKNRRIDSLSHRGLVQDVEFRAQYSNKMSFPSRRLLRLIALSCLRDAVPGAVAAESDGGSSSRSSSPESQSPLSITDSIRLHPISKQYFQNGDGAPSVSTGIVSTASSESFEGEFLLHFDLTAKLDAASTKPTTFPRAVRTLLRNFGVGGGFRSSLTRGRWREEWGED